MSKYLSIDLNIFMSLVLIMIVRMMHSKQSYISFSTRLFLLLCWSTIILLMLDAFSWVFNGSSYWVVNISIYAFYLIETVPLVLWLCYLDYYIHQSEKRLRKRWYYMQPVILIFILLIINIFTDFLFYIDQNNMYQRGPGIFLILTLNFSILLVTLFIALKQRKQLEKRVFTILVLFGIFPIIGGISQLFVYGATVLWNTVALSVIFIYIFLETQKELRDYLTGLLNRQQIDEMILSRMIDYGKKVGFAVIMLDMDDFKIINDSYGHKEGDRALIRVSEILHNSVKKIDHVGRFGGDEFLILMEEDQPEHIMNVIQRIQDSLSIENSTNGRPYNLSLSAGFAVYSSEKYKDRLELLSDADKNMYSNKSSKKTS